MEHILFDILRGEGLKTHFVDFDDLTGGLHKSELIVVAGRPSMGKTTLVMNIAENVAMLDKKTVGVFWLQMSRESLVLRLLSSQSDVDTYKIRAGFVNRKERSKLVEGLGVLLETPPLYIADIPEISISEMRVQCQRLRQKHDSLDLVIVDCIRLVSVTDLGESSFRGSRHHELSELSRSLKSLAKELACPVIAVCGLTGALQGWTNARPRLSDLDEFGSIEAEADVVVFLHRQEIYSPCDPEFEGKAELIVAKQRNGGTGIIPLHFMKTRSRFVNVANFAEQS